MAFPAEQTSAKRSEIQALRAVAVLLVVVAHIWPAALPGGYIGVDVFFVISGFLITSHLIRDVVDTGRLSLLRFWGRRIRRLLPAAFVVLLFCLAAAVVVLPSGSWPQTMKEIAASALYAENWVLAADSVDYMAAENDASMLQHFWSLSVEEQFYILWPLLIIAAVGLAGALRRRRGGATAATRRRAILSALAGVAIASLAASIVWTSVSQPSAYFSTATRAWEFAAGGMLAFAPSLMAISSARLRQAAHLTGCWGGLALIVLAATQFGPDTAFPGAAAIVPVLGTALVIWAQSSDHSWSPSVVGRFGPVQFLGDISYSVYLWHWPLVVLYPIVVGRPIGIRGGLALVVASVALGALSKRLVEDPFRRNKFWALRQRRSFLFAATGMATTIALSFGAIAYLDARVAEAAVADGPWESAVEVQEAVAATLRFERFPVPDQLAGPEAHVDEWRIDDCVSVMTEAQRTKCTYGREGASRSVVLIGDSFGTHFLPAIRDEFGSDHEIHTLTLGQCSVTRAHTRTWTNPHLNETCEAHNKRNLDWLRSNKPDLLLVADATESTLTRILGAANPSAKADLYVDGLQAAYTDYASLGVPVVVLESAPKSNCFAESNLSSPALCKPTSTTTFAIGVQMRKERAAREAGLGYMSLTDWMCTPDGVCPDQIGNMLTRADRAHMTETWAESLRTLIGSAIRNEMD